MVFDAAPQPLDEGVVSPRISAVHADRDAVLDQQARNAAPVNCEPLVGVEDLRLAALVRTSDA